MKELSIYIHTPFCKSKCNYCSFYSVPLSKLKPVSGCAELEQYPEFLIKEINMEAEKYSLGGSRVNSIYFGGGTPSVMPAGFFSGLINHIRENFEIAEAVLKDRNISSFILSFSVRISIKSPLLCITPLLSFSLP